MRSSLLLLFIICFSVNSQIVNFPFQKKVWTYWHQDDFSTAPMLVRQCSQQIKNQAQKAGLEYFLLSKSTVRQYITNFDQKITKVRQKSKQHGLAYEADLIRFHLILQNGGVWIDITTALPQGLDWLINIKSEKYRNMITNRFSQDPDVLLCYFQGYQNTQQYRVQVTTNNPMKRSNLVLYNQFPGYEVWFFAAKKNSSLIHDIIETYSLFTQLDFIQLTQKFHDQDIYMNNVELYGTHLTLNMAISYTLQIRQLKLDQQKNLFSKRQTVYENYNLWSLSGFLGPLIWPKGIAGWKFIELDAEGFEERQYIMKFFVKMSGWFNSRIAAQLQYLENLFGQDGGQTFEQFLAKNPTHQQCIDTTFFVNGSVLYETLKSLPQIASGRIQTISVQQRRRWQKHCSKYQEQIPLEAQIERIFLPEQSTMSIPFYKVHQTIDFDKRKKQTFKQNLLDFLFERKGEIQYFFRCLLNFSLFSIAEVAIIKNLQFIWRKLKKSSKNSVIEKVHSKISSFVLFLFIVLSGTFTFYQFTVIDYFGQKDDLPTIILVLVSVFWMQNYVERRVENNQTLKTYYNLMVPLINFCAAYLTFCNTRKYKVTLVYCSLIVGLLGSCLLKLIDSLHKVKQTKNNFLILFKKLSQKNVYRIGSVVLVTIMYISPNFRYATLDGKYLVSYLPIMLSFGVLTIYLMALIECFRNRVKMQILNLLILGLLSLYLKGLILEKMKHTYNNVWKVTWYINLVFLYSTIYQQIGSSFSDKKIQSRNTIIAWIKYFAVNLLKLGIFYLGFVIEINGKQMNEMNQNPGNLLKWMKKMVYLTLNCLIIGVYVLLTGQQTQFIYIEGTQSVEMEISEPNIAESKLDFQLPCETH